MFLRALFCLPLLLAVALRAQSVRWEPDGGTLALNQLSQLTLIFDQCQPQGAVNLPAASGLDFGAPSRSEQNSFSIINGNASHSVTVSLSYQVRPSTRQTIVIPAFDVATDKGAMHVDSVTFTIGDATVGEGNLSLDTLAQSSFTLPSAPVWAGEVFPLRYTLNVSRRYFYQLGGDLNWDPAPLSIEPWGQPTPLATTLNGENRVSVLYSTRAVAKSPGALALNPATQLVNLVTGTSSFSVFARPDIEQFTVTSKPATLAVRPLPAPAPADFAGAVGQFTLDSKVVPETTPVGEPVTWTLTLSGTGNWPDIGGLPPRRVSKDFRVIQPAAKRTPSAKDSLFDASLAEDVVLVPTKPGTYTLGPVTLGYFDPKVGAFRTLATQPVTITVTGAPVPPPDANSASTSPNASASGSQPSTPNPQPPPAPARIPRDPLAPASPAPGLLDSRTLFTVLLPLAALVPLLAWLALALSRARRTDPRLPQRAARARLAATLAELRRATDAAQIPLLLQRWQHDTAILWRLDLAVPTPEALKTAAATKASTSPAAKSEPSKSMPSPAASDSQPSTLNPQLSSPADAWLALWTEADRVLYRASATLPADWIDRAQAALATRRVRGFSPLQLFLPRNILPLFAVLFLACAVVPPHALAANSDSQPSTPNSQLPSAAYARGDFKSAATDWTAALQAAPTDWTARHNLSLTLAQQGHWNEAAGQALAAFVQHPQNPAVRWNLRFTLAGAGLDLPEVDAFLPEPDAPHRLALLASPAVWQRLLIAAVWLAALAVALWLALAYARRRLKVGALILLGLAVLAALVSACSLRLYGPLGEANTVFVSEATVLRSIPTDLDSPQKTTPLAAGLIATTDKTFLDWRRLVFPDGQTGWVRAATLTPLWR